MISCFSKSKYAYYGIFTFYIIIALYLFFNKQTASIFINIFILVFLILFGYFIARVVGKLISERENTKLLQKLYIDLDADSFIKDYKPVISKLDSKSSMYAVCSSYLCDAYALKKDYQMAAAELSLAFSGVKDTPSLKSLYLANMLRYNILADNADNTGNTNNTDNTGNTGNTGNSGNTDNVRLYLISFQNFLENMKEPALEKLKLNMQQTYMPYIEYARYLLGLEYDMEKIRSGAQNTPVLTHRNELNELLQRINDNSKTAFSEENKNDN